MSVFIFVNERSQMLTLLKKLYNLYLIFYCAGQDTQSRTVMPTGATTFSAGFVGCALSIKKKWGSVLYTSVAFTFVPYFFVL